MTQQRFLYRQIKHGLLFGLLFLKMIASSYATEAHTDTEALAKAAQNPVADLISLPFQNNTNLNIPPFGRNQNVMNIQPVIPYHLTPKWNIITRAILPVIHQPDLLKPHGAVDGVGNLNPTFFLSPNAPGKFIWGLGPTFLAPTSSNAVLGPSRWGAGPSAVILTMPGHWVIGALANNIWSVTGDARTPKINQFLTQYFINYNLPKGWYVTSSPIITANWEAPTHDVWTVPFGGGAGRLFKIEKLPININVQGFYNTVRPTEFSNWTVRAQLQFLFPT